MKTFPSPPFSSIPTIDSVYHTVENFRDRLEPIGEGSESLSALDAYLLSLIIDFWPQPAFVADLACHATSGSTSVICLANPRTSRVAIATAGASRWPGDTDLRKTLEEFSLDHLGPERRGRLLSLGAIENVSDSLRTSIPPHEVPLVVVDAADIGQTVGCRLDEILGDLPRGLITVTNVGRVGECEAAQRLVEQCRKGLPYRLWLMPEVSSSLWGSRLAVIARRDHTFANSLIRRIDHCFTTNFDFLDLVRDSCSYAVEKGIADDQDREIVRLQESLHTMQESLRTMQTQLSHELSRPVRKGLIMQTAYRLVSWGRRNRRFLAPANSLRERTLKSLMQFQRRVRNKVL